MRGDEVGELFSYTGHSLCRGWIIVMMGGVFVWWW